MADSKLNSIPHLRNLCFTTEQLNSFLKGGKSQYEIVPRPTWKEDSSATIEKCSIGGDTSSYKCAYLNLPHHLKICLDYCCFVLNRFRRVKNELARLLVAEGLILQDELGNEKEDIALSIIEELTTLGMLLQYQFDHDYVEVPSSYRDICAEGVDTEDFAIDSPIRLYISLDLDNRNNVLSPNVDTLPITSLFVHEVYNGDEYRMICKLKSLVVLELSGRMECLPYEIGDLVHLKYLGLSFSCLEELPTTIGRLQNLETLDLDDLELQELPIEVFDIQSLRHLFISGWATTNGEIRVPRKIGIMNNLRSLQGVYAGRGIAEELGKLTQLRQLEVMRVSEDHACELSASIMKMTNLIHLSMSAEQIHLSMTAEQTIFEEEEEEEEPDEFVGLFPEMETFSPPPLLQRVRLSGQLVEMPSWLVSMQNLTELRLHYSYLRDNPTSEIQFLPNLKHLFLDNAFKTKCINEEFCEPGGFPNLKTLAIQSEDLVEWTEIVDGAFPSLESLNFERCFNFRFFPNGLENICTLKKLAVLPIYGDLKRRLEGEENYKIKNIPNVQLGHS